MKRFALCLIVSVVLTRPAGAKEIICSWHGMGGHYRDVTCHVIGEHDLPHVGVSVDALTPTPEMVRLVGLIVRGSEIDPRLVLAVIAAESAFDSRAVSRKNAMGLMQLMPDTIARFGVRNPFDAEENVRAGVSYLEILLRKYNSLKLALAAYNAGEGPVLSYGAVPPYAETTEYVERVLRLYARYKQMPLDPSQPVKLTSTLVPRTAKTIGNCGLVCRGSMLAARLDEIGARVRFRPTIPRPSNVDQ